MSGSQRWWMGIVGVMASALCAVAVAWACTPTADMTAGPGSGPPGTQVTFTGTGFDKGIVELRMDSTTSAPLATVQGPSFSVTLTVPETSPGYHTFGAVGYNEDGVAVGEASVPFEVTGPASEPAPSVAPTVPRESPKPAARRPAPGSVERVSEARRPERNDSSGSAARPAAPVPAAPAPRIEEAIAAAPAEPAGAPAQAVTRDRPGREAPADRDAASAPSALNDVGRLELGAPVPARGAAPADPWAARSGATENSSAGPGAQVAIGAGVLALGLVALFGGFAVAEARRRRALATSRRRR